MKYIALRLVQLYCCFGLCVLIQATPHIISGSKIRISMSSSERGRKNAFIKSCLPNGFNCKSLILRGGSDSDESDGDDEENNEESSEVLDKAIDLSKKSISAIGKIVKTVTTQALSAAKRAFKAGLEGGNDEEEQGVISKAVNTLSRMIKAVFTFDVDSDCDEEDAAVSDDGDNDTTSEDESEISAKKSIDFGSFLSKTYGKTDNRGDEGPAFLGGTLANACEIARSQARMLVVFLPSKRPTKGKETKDGLAIQSLLSADVAAAANKQARRKGGETGSFLIWGAKAGSSEAAAAIKRLKTKTTSQKGGKRPVLAVVYPAKAESAGGIKLVPKVLAQHHCSPPPTESLMASWLDALRKRHAKQYSSMQTDLKEAQYYKERLDGYSDSVKSDNERKQREKEEEEKRLAEEAAEKERQEAIEKRREELKESLPEEHKSPDAKRIALRFGDGRSGERHFSPSQPIADLFNWVDAIYEMEREKVVLTTMNGKQTFTWDEEENSKELSEFGIGKNTGFRVTEKKDEVQEDESEDDP